MKTKLTALILMIASTLMAAPQGERRARGFDKLDSDGDGQVTLAEFNQAHEARFTKLDSNGDGVLTSDELGRQRMRGRDGGARGKVFMLIADTDGDRQVTSAELEAVLEQVVGDDGETIDHEKVMALLPDHPRGGMYQGENAPTATLVRNMFTKLDVDGNGTVTGEELGAMRQRGRRGNGGPMILKAADSNDDHAVSQDEWQTFVGNLETDADGNISLGTLIAAVHAAADLPEGMRGPGPLVGRLDSDGDGNLTANDLDDFFEKLDADGNGIITIDEAHGNRRGPRSGRR
jgi:Ca2+-binding EF-hand superfamily protein